MPDDTVTARLGQITAELEEIKAEVAARDPGDAIDQLTRLELLRGDDAALVGGRDTSTLARWAAAAESEGVPIAIKIGNSWLFVTNRLLGYIERTSGLYTRREAETRLRKLSEMRASAQNPSQRARPRARHIASCG
jgi:hypothetical protein